ncbi:MAG TPA: hypothetical protein VKB31_00275 [Trueperaceae bacterium]|nr:hypothetical protein [Trueperaceae bacterium]
MSDPASRRVFLRSLPDGPVPGRHSSGARRRTAALQRFLLPLELVARDALPVEGRVQLLVVASRDWRRLSSYPYGLPFARTGNGLVSLIVPADYPTRLTGRFDELLLTAGRGGVRAPGDIHEFLDLLVGHEWGHAVANRSGLRTRVKWFDEVVATYLFAQGLRAADELATLERLRRWAALQIAATADRRGALDGFEYPRGKMPLARMLWYQGIFTQQALSLSAERGWSFARAMAARLPAADRGALARALVDEEPSFRPWFAVFAPDAEEPAGGAGVDG